MSIPAAFEAATHGAVAAATDHVFGPGASLDRDVAELARLVDPAFLGEVGWDPASLVLFLPPAHRLLGRPVCTAAGCAVIAPQRSRICAGCQRRLAESGLGPDQVELLPARERRGRGLDGCVVEGCGREWAGSAQLCRQHLDQRQLLGLSMAEFMAYSQTTALTACAPC